MGCIPLCPQELSLPNLGCPSPRLVKVPGQCCEEWVCDESKDALDELEGFFSKEFGLDASEGELTRNNELIAIVKGGLKMLPGEYEPAWVTVTVKVGRKAMWVFRPQGKGRSPVRTCT